MACEMDETSPVKGDMLSETHIMDASSSPPLPSGSPVEHVIESGDGSAPPVGITSDTDLDQADQDDEVDEWQKKSRLRPQGRELRSTFTRTWIDDDETGLYDPVEEQRRLRQRTKRPNPLLKRGFTPWDLDEQSDEETNPREKPAPKEVPKLEVTLAFRSEAGKAAFEKHVKSLPTTSEPSEALFSERRLRRRDSGVGFSHALGTTPSKRKRLPEDFPEDLTGHPVARGCWGCVTLGIRCPLLDDDRAWPCTTCLDDDNECELITPPAYKRPCEHCKSKRLGCSYTYSLDHEGPCEECSHTGWRCIAGPAKEAIRERVSYDRDWENDPWQAPKVPKPKKIPSCKKCRERGQPCSFAAGDKADVCTACDMAGEACVPELEMPQSGRKRKRTAKAKTSAGGKKSGEEKRDEEGVGEGDDNGKGPWGRDIFQETKKSTNPIVVDESDGDSEDDLGALLAPKKPKSNEKKPVEPIFIESSDESSSADDSDIAPPPKKKTFSNANIKGKTKQQPQHHNAKGALTTITTEFSHPIAFNHEGAEPCNFCRDIRFAMFGLGPVEVEVVVWDDGRGLEEIQGGHRGRGVERTRMCVECTTSRIPVIMCPGHGLGWLEGELRFQRGARDSDVANGLLVYRH